MMAAATADKRNIAQRIHACMNRVDYIQKEEKAGMKYSIVSHDKVTELVRPHLVENGVIYFPIDMSVKQDGTRTEAVFKVRFMNVDDPDDFIDVSTMGYGVDSSDKGPGKAISYGVKYALLKALGLATGDDPDLDQTSTHRSTLDQRVTELETAVSASPDTVQLKALMAAPPTAEIMSALQTRNPGEFNRVRALMAQRSRELKEQESVDQTRDG